MDAFPDRELPFRKRRGPTGLCRPRRPRHNRRIRPAV
jgi:hypothetical protein